MLAEVYMVKKFNVAPNSFQHFSRRRFWWISITTQSLVDTLPNNSRDTTHGFHMTSLKAKLQSYWSSWDFTFMKHKSSWKLISIDVFAPYGFLFVCDRLRLLLSDAAFTWRPRELSWWFKFFFGKFGYLNSLCIIKNHFLNVLSS